MYFILAMYEIEQRSQTNKSVLVARTLLLMVRFIRQYEFDIT